MPDPAVPDPALPADTEIELKLALLPAQAAAFARDLGQSRDLSQHGTPQTHALVTRYFDTPDGALRASGVALRLRRDGRRWWQTVKTSGLRSGGLSTRDEFETRVARGEFDWSRLPATALALIPEAARARLVCVFETRFTRLAWPFAPRAGVAVEVALDRGEIVAGKRRAPLCEIELELKAGAPSDLFELARDWAARYDCLPLAASKAARGADLVRGDVERPHVARPPRLAPKIRREAAFVALCENALDSVQANLLAILQPRADAGSAKPGRARSGADKARASPCPADPEYVHQTRVALRRLRAALRLFKAPCPLPDDLAVTLKALATALGGARDADVFATETVPAIVRAVAASPAPGVDAALLQAAANLARSAAHARAVADLRALAPGRWLLDMHYWLHRRGWRAHTARLDRPFAAKSAWLERPLAPWASRRLARNQRKLAALAAMTSADPDALHTLRIAIKRQRYALEACTSLWPEGRHANMAKSLQTWQAALGADRDLQLARHQLTGIEGLPPDLVAYAHGWLTGTIDARAAAGSNAANCG